MAAPSLTPWNQASRRSLPRYAIDVSLDVIALQSGIPYNMPGRCCDLSESGLGAVVAGELLAGQSVAVELRLPNVGLPVRARAQVRYQERLRCGLQFVGLSVEQREKIRYWASQNTAPIVALETAAETVAGPLIETKDLEIDTVTAPQAEQGAPSSEKHPRRFRVRRRRFLVLVAFMMGLAALGWWQWQNSWSELEVAAPVEAEAQPGMPLRVPSEAMDHQILYKIEPIYPDAAREAGTQGLVVLDAVISADGTVKSLRAVAGPASLSQSALDAVQSWKYSPYRVQGSPVEVETTVSVDFRVH
jgi:TonB family protein